MPSDIIAQLRFINEQRAAGRKASTPKDMKRLLSQRQRTLSSSVSEDTVWITPADQPHMRARIRVVHNGNDVDVVVLEDSTALSILEVCVMLMVDGWHLH